MGIRTLLRIAMVTPTRQGVCAPSRAASEPKEISDKEFYKHWADSARGIRVSRDADGKSNPTTETAYGRGLDAWYVEATDKEIADYEAAIAAAEAADEAKPDPPALGKITTRWQEDGSYTTEGGIGYTADELWNAAYDGADFSIDNSL